jgi:hypothetical protein
MPSAFGADAAGHLMPRADASPARLLLMPMPPYAIHDIAAARTPRCHFARGAADTFACDADSLPRADRRYGAREMPPARVTPQQENRRHAPPLVTMPPSIRRFFSLQATAGRRTMPPDMFAATRFEPAGARAASLPCCRHRAADAAIFSPLLADTPPLRDFPLSPPSFLPRCEAAAQPTFAPPPPPAFAAAAAPAAVSFRRLILRQSRTPACARRRAAAGAAAMRAED